MFFVCANAIIETVKKFPLVIGLATLALIIGGALLFSKNPAPQPSPSPLQPSTHEYFFSPTCPHCTNVAEFMETWNKKETFATQKYDVNSAENSDLFVARGKACDIRPSELGVPLLVTPEGKCIVGDTPIIDYLKTWNQEQ